jgi:hypothetical protein
VCCVSFAVGRHNIISGTTGVEITVKSKRRHPQYSSTTEDKDVAILELNAAIPVQYYAPIQLNSATAKSVYISI